jgi:hypothetical protein
MIEVTIPLRTGRGLNDRMHHMVRAKKVRTERRTVHWYLKMAAPFFPAHLTGEQRVVVTLRRCGPTKGLDSDNICGAMKGCRDGVADWIGIDDGSERVAWNYEQERANAWGVLVRVEIAK